MTSGEDIVFVTKRISKSNQVHESYNVLVSKNYTFTIDTSLHSTRMGSSIKFDRAHNKELVDLSKIPKIQWGMELITKVSFNRYIIKEEQCKILWS